MRVLGINAIFHDPAATLVVDGQVVAAGRPMADAPRDALECFGSAPVDMLVLGPYVVRRGKVSGR
jgi:carbamoyltransferase